MSNDKILPHKWAGVGYSEKGIFIVTRSGNVMTALDDQGARHFLPRDASNRSLGEALLACLAASRVIDPDDWKAFFDWRDADRRYKVYLSWQMKIAEVKTQVALYRNMMECAIHVKQDMIVVDSCHHEQVKEWLYPKNLNESAVRIPFAGTAPEIGAALREAMNRCTGLGREEAQLPEPLPD